MRVYSFENLGVWKKAKQLVKIIYQKTAKFPPEEKYGITQQLRRAGVSICSNIAEGNGRISGKEQARFTEIAYGSLLEVINQFLISVDLEYITRKEVDDLRPLFDQLTSGLNNLRKSQLNKKK